MISKPVERGVKMNDILTIKEVADLTKKTTQSIYKRINKTDNPIQAYIVMEGDQTMLKKDKKNKQNGFKNPF